MHWNPFLAQARLHRKALECCPGIYSIIFIITAKKIHFSPLSVCLEGLLMVFFWPWGRMGSGLFFGFGLGWPSLLWHAEWISQHGTRTSMVWLTTCSRWEEKPRFSIACGCSCSFALLKRLKIPWDQANFIPGWQLENDKTAQKLILKSFLYCIFGLKMFAKKVLLV